MENLKLVCLDNIVKWRDHLHENPELSFQEYKTSQYIFDVLTSFGSLDISRPTPTSVVAVLDTKRVGQTIAMRADMDALPMSEEADVVYKSKNEGVMHSCGHDTHVAMLLGAAEALIKVQDQLTGKVKFIFQHAEEKLPGGARELVQAGVLEGVDKIFGLHIGGGYPEGLVMSRIGALTASTDSFEITLTGKGSHGSTPELSIDLVVVGAQIVNALQTIVSRTIPTAQQAVVTVGQFNIGTAPNIIAQTGFMSGTVRTTDKDVRKLIQQRVCDIVNSIASLYGAQAEINYILGYSSVVNDEAAFNSALASATEIVGEQNIVILPSPMMGGEDFSAYTEVIPGCFLMVGGGNEEGYGFFNHHPKFRITKNALLIGAQINMKIVLDLLKK